MAMMLEGGCRCGAVRYRISGVPKFGFACHCTDCQQLSASAYSLGLALAEHDFEVTRGEPREWDKRGSSGKPSHQYSCPTCAGWTHTRPESERGTLIVRPTTLDDHRWFRPVAQIFVRSALPWANMPAVASFETQFDDPESLAAAYHAAGIGPGSSNAVTAHAAARISRRRPSFANPFIKARTSRALIASALSTSPTR